MRIPKDYPKGLVCFERQYRYLDAWKSYFFSKDNKLPECEICEKILKYFSGNKKGSVHFDHKKVCGIVIKGSPSGWLRNHKITSENIVIWESCNFGILCNECNKRLPTKTRKKWLKKVIRYINKN